MGWRDVLGYTSESDTQNSQNPQNPGPTLNFGDIGNFGERDSMSTPTTARDKVLEQAAQATDLDPKTLEALLSAEDREDLDAGLMTYAELRGYAQSVSRRCAHGWILPDERDLHNSEIQQLP